MFVIAKRLFILFLFVCTLSVLSCSDDDNDSPTSPADESSALRIGALFDFREDGPVHGQSMLAALEVAEEDIKAWFAENDVDAELSFVAHDTESDADAMLDYLAEMAESGTSVILTPMTSAELDFFHVFAEDYDIVLVSPTSTSTELSVDDDVFRLLPDDSVQSSILARALADEGKRKLFVVARQDIWGMNLSEELAAAFTEGGGTHETTIGYASVDPLFEMEMVIAELDSLVADELERSDASEIAVFIACFEEGIEYFKEASRYPNLAKVNWFSADGIAKNSDLLAGSEAAAFAASVGLKASIFGEPESEEMTDVKQKIMEKTGIDPYTPATLMYDAAWIAAQTAVAAGTNGKDDFKAKFIEFAETHEGLFGKAKLNENGDRANGSFNFLTVIDHSGNYAWEKSMTYEIGQ